MDKKLTKKKPHKSQAKDRKAVFELSEVLPFVSSDGKNTTKEYLGETIPMDWDTLQVLKVKGCDCVSCNAKADFVAMEKTPGPKRTIYNEWHFNVYAKDYLGRPVLMTKDHILAKANGGKDEMDNYQPMCSVCNTRKGALPQRYFDVVVQESFDNFDDFNLSHTIKRVQERWGLTITKEDYCNMSRQIREGEDTILYRKNKSTTYREVKIQGENRIVLFSNKHGIITALKEDVRLAIDKSVPWWAQENVEEAISEYEEIISIAESEYETKNSGREYAEYFKTCRYPKVMFSMWKGKGTDKFKSIVWEHARRNLKLN